MSTLAELTDLIDDNIRNKTPKVVKTEHADVEQGLANEFFKAPVKVEWNGTSSVSPTTDIVVESGIASGTLIFTVHFWKSGNTVYFNGKIRNSSSGVVTSMKIIDFATGLYEPLSISTTYAEMVYDSPNLNTTTKIKVSSSGVEIFGDLIAGSFYYNFFGEYKVAN